MQFFGQPSPERNCALDIPRRQPVANCSTRFVEVADQDAFASLVRIHGPIVLGVCRRVALKRSSPRCRRGFSAAFLVLCRKAPSICFRDTCSQTLSFTASRIARLWKLRTATAKEPGQGESSLPCCPRPVAPQERDWEEISPLLDQGWSRLPDTYRAAVICCDLQGYSRADASATAWLA